MDLTSFLMSWSPVLLLAVLAAGAKRPALELSLYGTGFTAILVWWYFRTPGSVILRAALDGLVTTLPLLLVVLAGILLSKLLAATGSLTRLVQFFFEPLGQPRHRQLAITLGLGNFLEGASVIAEPLVAPMLRTAGVAPAGAAALSIIGYAGLMSVEMAGIIITVLALVTGLPPDALAREAAGLSVPATLILAGAIPWYLPHHGHRLSLFWQSLGGALVVSLVAWGATVLLGVALAGILGGLGLIGLFLLAGTGPRYWHEDLRQDLAIFGCILLPLLAVNLIPGLRELTLRRWVITLEVIPVHRITLTPLFSAYLYLFLAVAAAGWWFRRRAAVGRVLLEGLAQSLKPLAAMALFGAMGQMIAYSGYGEGFAALDQIRNIPWVLATGLKTATGPWYPFFVPLLGWVGTFLTGYGVASLLLFGELQVQAAQLLGVSPVWLAAGLTVGSAVGSVSSPFKIAIATPMCGAVGQEGEILRRTIPLGLAACLLLGLIVWW